MTNRVIFLADMQSFYASVEKADHPALKDQPVIVSGDPERRSGVVLAACPLAKRYGVQNAWRLWEAQQKCPQAIIIRPRMARYIEVSYKITKILERFTDQVEVFSVDEQFLDVTESQNLFGDPWMIARNIQQTIMHETGVPARIGMASNKVLAKTACDHFAKKNHEGIFHLNASNMKKKMWPLPVDEMFGVGARMVQHLRRMGIRTIGQLANFPLHVLKKRWGVNGHLLWQTANGIDHSPVTSHTYNNTQKAIGHNMTLPRDYTHKEEIEVVLLELSEEVARRARAKHFIGYTVSIGIRGADFTNPTGFHRQTKLSEPSHFGMDIFKAIDDLFCCCWNGFPVRSVQVTLSQLQPENPMQLSFFDDFSRKERLSRAMDHMHAKYGPTAIVRAVSLTEAGQVYKRADKIGGHYK